MPEKEFQSLKRETLERRKDATDFENKLFGMLATAFDGADPVSNEALAKTVVAASYEISPELLQSAEDVRVEMGQNNLQNLEKAMGHLRELNHEQLVDIPFCRGLAYAYLDALKKPKSG